jgi:hypothetical protein
MKAANRTTDYRQISDQRFRILEWPQSCAVNHASWKLQPGCLQCVEHVKKIRMRKQQDRVLTGGKNAGWRGVGSRVITRVSGGVRYTVLSALRLANDKQPVIHRAHAAAVCGGRELSCALELRLPGNAQVCLHQGTASQAAHFTLSSITQPASPSRSHAHGNTTPCCFEWVSRDALTDKMSRNAAVCVRQVVWIKSSISSQFHLLAYFGLNPAVLSLWMIEINSSLER